MSINSKAKRDARRKQQRNPVSAKPTAPIHAKARLMDDAGNVIGGAGLRGEDWVLILGGKVVATTDSASMVLAMLERTRTVRAGAGQRLRVDVSPALTDAATAEAGVYGRTLDEHLAALESERAEHAARRQADEAGPTSH